MTSALRSRMAAWRADIADRVAARPAAQTDLLGTVYAIPDPFATFEQWQRWVHADIAEMTDAQLRREYKRANDRLAYEDTPGEWLIARVARLRAEGDLRRQGGGHQR